MLSPVRIRDDGDEEVFFCGDTINLLFASYWLKSLLILLKQ